MARIPKPSANARRFAKYIERYGYTYRALGDALAVTGETVRLWAAGLAVPSAPQARRIEERTGIKARNWPRIRMGRPRKEATK